ncbi:MAG: TusE/DsrC/DsvC family sulfur relay protein [Thermoplasmata archaeon]
MADEKYVVVKNQDGSDKKIAIDEDGFIKDPADWCEAFALAVAKDEGIEKLTEEHLKVINYLRSYFLQFDSCPPIKMLLKNTGLDIKTLYALFPTGPAKGACRLAGAPKPTGCV